MYKVHFIQPARRKGLDQREDYRAYREELKEDFHAACGYCGDDCIHFEPHIDHFRPQHPAKVTDEAIKALFQEVKTSYSNLVFSCPFCNRRKSNKWPTGDFHSTCTGVEGFIDPCDPYYNDQLARHRDGRIYGKTDLGNYMARELGLGLFRHQLLWLIKKARQLQNNIAKSKFGDEIKGKALSELTFALDSLEKMLRGDI